MATMTVNVQGLTEPQKLQLEGVQVGNLVWLEYRAPPPEMDEEDEDDVEDDDEIDVENEDEDEPYHSGDEDGGEGSEDEGLKDDLPTPTNIQSTAASGEAGEVDQDGVDGEDESDEGPAFSYGGFCGLALVSGTTSADGSIQDLTFVKLAHVVDARGSTDPHGFQIYGDVVTHSPKHCNHASSQCSNRDTLLDMTYKSGFENVFFQRNPRGSTIRTKLFGRHCLANCKKGWLSSIAELTSLVKDYDTPALLDHEIACPVCLGLDITREQQSLRATLDLTSYIDFGAVVEWWGRLTPRRLQTGYHFQQFDERSWGYAFDDLLSEDEEGGDADQAQGQLNIGYEHWAEAMDPNSEVHRQTRPASDAVIAALPRKTFRDMQVKYGDETKCTICQEQFKADQIVVELPCVHYFCDNGCVEHWLKQYDNCPVCRHRVFSTVEDSAQKDGQDFGVDYGLTGDADGDWSICEQAEAFAAEEMDGQDAVTSDI